MIEVGEAVPLQLCGPVSEIFPSVVTLPMKPLNGAANDSEQAFSVTMTLCPTSDESQCAVIFHAPDTSGQVPPSPLLEDEPELHDRTSGSIATRTRLMASILVVRRSFVSDGLA
jgi:hypothetical protein